MSKKLSTDFDVRVKQGELSVIVEKTSLAKKTVSSLINFFSERVKIEGDYAKRLYSLSKTDNLLKRNLKTYKNNEQSTLRSVLDGLIETTFQEAELHMKLSDSLSILSVKPLTALLQSLRSHKKSWMERIAINIKEVRQAENELTKERSKSESANKEIERLSSRSDRKSQEKLFELVSFTQQNKTHSLNQNLGQWVKIQSEANGRYHLAMSHILEEIEDLELQRLRDLKESVAQAVELLQTVAAASEKEYGKLERAVCICNPDLDFQEFVGNHSRKESENPQNKESPKPAEPRSSVGSVKPVEVEVSFNGGMEQLPEVSIALIPADAEYLFATVPTLSPQDISLVFFASLALCKPVNSFSLSSDSPTSALSSHIRSQLKLNSKQISVLLGLFSDSNPAATLESRLYRLFKAAEIGADEGVVRSVVRAEVVHGWSNLLWSVKREKGYFYESQGFFDMWKGAVPDLAEGTLDITSAVSSLLSAVDSTDYTDLGHSLYYEYPTRLLYLKPLYFTLVNGSFEDFLYENWSDLLTFYSDLGKGSGEMTFQWLAVVHYAVVTGDLLKTEEGGNSVAQALQQIAGFYARGIRGDEKIAFFGTEMRLKIDLEAQMLAQTTHNLLLAAFLPLYRECTGSETHFPHILEILSFLHTVQTRGEAKYDWSVLLRKVVDSFLSTLSQYCSEGNCSPVAFLSDLLKVVLEEVKKEKSRQGLWVAVCPGAYDYYAQALSQSLVAILTQLLSQLPRAEGNSTVFQVNEQVLKLAAVLSKFDIVAKTEVSVVLLPSLANWLEGRFGTVEEAMKKARGNETWLPADVRGT